MPQTTKYSQTIVIGAGASGLFLAAHTPCLVLEQSSKLGSKILASGGGKCNATNEFISSKNYLGNALFIDEILKNWSYKDTLEFFNDVKFSKIKNHQFFANSSKDLLNSLIKKTTKSKILLNTKIIDVNKNGDIYEIYSENSKFRCRNLVVASGGLSYPNLGVSRVGYDIASKFGHSINTLNPALVGLSVQKNEFWMKSLSGVSLNASLKVAQRELKGDLLFTHKGISGPLALNASLFWHKGECEINFIPNFSLIDVRNSRKQLVSTLPLPKNFIKAY
ncbi:MAG: aminoacetone oxidase family FAD-binding enzyme, partial [Campylobacter sp.]|nr:aminoacetone oxidase family FAD-binding enzyme [Campylobacter sp.]